MANMKVQSNTETVESHYREKFSEWLHGVAFRLFVILTLMALTLVNLLTLSTLFEQGILTEGKESMKMVFALLGLLLTAFMIREFVRGLAYAMFSQTGRHRAYLLVWLAIAVGFTIKTTAETGLTGENAEAFVGVARAISIIVGIDFATGAVFESDIRKIQDWLPTAQSH